MFFNSINYLVFLPIIFAVFLLFKFKNRWLVLLCASYYFYFAFQKPSLLVVLLLVTIVTYIFGILIHLYSGTNLKKLFFGAGITILVLILVYLKYLNFFIINLSALFDLNLQPGGMLFTGEFEFIGLSYFTFQALSYLMDINSGTFKPERNIGIFALYLSFFPKLLQGPIERADSLITQLRVKYVFDYDNFRRGLFLILWGLFKKVIIADNLARLVNPVYDNVYSYSGFPLWTATFFFALQLYFDFSGYTDMALGSARLFNIKLTKNFNNPYFATSVSDFWRRWHISFSRWLLDYIFTPLQLRLKSLKIWSSVIALFVTFLLCGVWHGASWNYIIWGLINGLFMSVSALTQNFRNKIATTTGIAKFPTLHHAVKVIITFTLVCLAWIFFRANSVEEAFYIYNNLFVNIGLQDIYYTLLTYAETSAGFVYSLTADMFDKDILRTVLVLLLLLSVLSGFVYFIIKSIKSNRFKFALYEQPVWFRWSLIYSLIAILLMFWTIAENVKFIYLKF